MSIAAGHELMTLSERNVALSEDYDEQKKLFVKFGLKPDGYVMNHYAIVLRKDGGHKLVKRGRPVSFVVDVHGNGRCVRAVEKTYAENMKLGGFAKTEFTNPVTAKHIIENEMASSTIEMGEIESTHNY